MTWLIPELGVCLETTQIAATLYQAGRPCWAPPSQSHTWKKNILITGATVTGRVWAGRGLGLPMSLAEAVISV